MRASVEKAWPAFCESYEGKTNYMYLDTKKLVTFGFGRMIEGNGQITDYGLALPWRDNDTKKYVLESRIKSEFAKVNSRTDLAPKGGYAFKGVSNIYVTDGVVNAVLLETTEDFLVKIKKHVPKFDDLYADAQLAIIDMSWWMGPDFFNGFPNFTKAVNAENYAGMAENCGTRAKAPRDARHKRLFLNASQAEKLGISPEILFDKKEVAA